MGEAFISRRGGGSTRLEKVNGTYGGSFPRSWENLEVSTDIYFLQAEALYTEDWTTQGVLEAFIEDGEFEVLSGSLSDFTIRIDKTSIKITTPYSNTELDGSHTKLYRFC